MTPSQERAWAAHRDAYLVEVDRADRSTSVAEQPPLDLATLYGRSAPLVVEIGSGTGHALAAAAEARPDADVRPEIADYRSVIDELDAEIARFLADAATLGD